MHTLIHKRIHVYTHLHTCTYTVTCMRGHMHTPHTYLHNTLVHTCAHTHSIHTYTCTHNTPTTLQYKYLAEEYKGPQLWSEGLTFSLNCNNWTVLFGLNLLNSFLPASKERGLITPSIRSLFIVKFCDFDGTTHIIHQKLVPVLLLYCWQEPHRLESQPLVPGQATLTKRQPLEWRASESELREASTVGTCEASFLSLLPTPTHFFDSSGQRIALWTRVTGNLLRLGVSARTSRRFLGSFPAPPHAFPELQMEGGWLLLQSPFRGTSLTRRSVGTEVSVPDVAPAWQLLSPLTSMWPLVAMIKVTSTSGGHPKYSHSPWE